jgi:hypothetical protein
VTTFKFKNDSDVWAAINALRVAADRYDEDAAQTHDGYEGLRRQFQDQAKTARRIADEFEQEAG